MLNGVRKLRGVRPDRGAPSPETAFDCTILMPIYGSTVKQECNGSLFKKRHDGIRVIDIKPFIKHNTKTVTPFLSSRCLADDWRIFARREGGMYAKLLYSLYTIQYNVLMSG